MKQAAGVREWRRPHSTEATLHFPRILRHDISMGDEHTPLEFGFGDWQPIDTGAFKQFTLWRWKGFPDAGIGDLYLPAGSGKLIQCRLSKHLILQPEFSKHGSVFFIVNGQEMRYREECSTDSASQLLQ